MLSPSASDDEMDDLERVRIEGAMIDAFVVNILVGMLWMLWILWMLEILAASNGPQIPKIHQISRFPQPDPQRHKSAQ